MIQIFCAFQSELQSLSSFSEDDVSGTEVG